MRYSKRVNKNTYIPTVRDYCTSSRITPTILNTGRDMDQQELLLLEGFQDVIVAFETSLAVSCKVRHTFTM